MQKQELVLVPFYRGAVVFYTILETMTEQLGFSSPFIEERLYLIKQNWNNSLKIECSRPLLSRSGCISQ